MSAAMLSPGRDPGCVYWLTGLAGAGKTTLANAFYAELHKTNEALVLLDGDELRRSIAEDLGYSREARVAAAMRYAKMAALLARQGLTVIVSTISMFHCVRDWNRENIPCYREVYLQVPLSVLEQRNQKHLYSNSGNGKITNVMGLDLEIEEPMHPDLVIENDGRFTVAECVAQLSALISDMEHNNEN